MSTETNKMPTGQETPNQATSYRSIFKATSLFGGVQVFQILINVVKSKIIAVLLGTAGVGVLGLYQSVTQLIQSLTSLGLSQSAVRDVSEANGTGDLGRISRIIIVLRKLVWITGLLGTFFVIVFSPVLSKTTFGNYDYTIPIVFLSITLLLDQLCSGQKAILQGLRKLKDLAKASVYGSSIGLIVSIPIYYFWGIQGIVPTLILNSATALLLSWYFSKKIKIHKIKITPKEVVCEGRLMLKMGIAMSISSIVSIASAYVLRGYLRMQGGVETVGLFTAGFAIINTYVGLVFTAMSTDFYPRLAAVNHDDNKCREIINQQGEIGALIMAPMLIIAIVFIPQVIILLYSNEFLDACGYVVFAALGMMFRFASVLVAHIFLAKSESKLYIINELAVCIYTLVLNVIGYELYGLKGLGLSFAVSYLLYMIQVYLISKKKYEFHYSKQFMKIFSFQLILVSVTLAIYLFMPSPYCYLLGTLLIIVSGIVSLKGLDKRMGLIGFIKSKFGKC